MGGEIINCLFMFFSFTYSLKTSLISFPLKFVEKFGGKLAFKTGAIVSLSPPVMVPRLAQLDVTNTKTKQINPIINFGMPLFFQVTK